MTISHINLPGLDQEKILAIVEPVLVTHRVDAVELQWRGTHDGKVLELTLEKPGSQRTGEGITIELCAEISRKLSDSFEEQELLPGKYRLEVGSPGVERALYLPEEYRRFAGQEVKVKLVEASELEGFIGQRTIRGNLFGLDSEGRAVLETDHGTIALTLEAISNAHLVFSWNQPKRSSGRRPPSSGTPSRTTKRSS